MQAMAEAEINSWATPIYLWKAAEGASPMGAGFDQEDVLLRMFRNPCDVDPTWTFCKCRVPCRHEDYKKLIEAGLLPYNVVRFTNARDAKVCPYLITGHDGKPGRTGRFPVLPIMDGHGQIPVGRVQITFDGNDKVRAPFTL